ncbi:DNA mismatch repair protein MutL [bacterium BMS3Abin08]|nr:DNA mismatch repair protein MutL [bacterium BMS3Abin08]
MKLNVTPLLFPQQITLPPRHYRIILNQLNSLGAMGIEIEDFGEGTLLLRAVPDILSDADLPSIISDLAESLFDIRASSPVEEIRDVIAKRIACHSSVRGRTELAPDEIKALLKDLREAQDPEHCPHGRPTRIHLGIEELKRMFKRT